MALRTCVRRMIAGSLVVAASPSTAVVIDLTNHWELAGGSALAEEHWVRAETIQVDGTVDQPLSGWARTVVLNGPVDAAVWLAATANLSWTNTATAPIRLAGRYLDLGGVAERSVVAAAETVSVQPLAVFHDTVAFYGLTVVANGSFRSNVIITANSITAKGRFGGDLVLRGDDINIAPGTEIDGDLVYASSRTLAPGSKVIIGGEIIRRPALVLGISRAQGFTILFAMFASAILVGIPAVRFCPRMFLYGGGLIVRSPFRCLLTGLAAVWLTPVLGWALLMMTFTLPFGLVLLATMFVIMYLAQIVIALLIGGAILRRTSSGTSPHAFLALGVGLVLLYAATLIPVVNLIIWAAVLTIGVGGLLLGLWSSQQVRVMVPGVDDELQSNDTDPAPEPEDKP